MKLYFVTSAVALLFGMGFSSILTASAILLLGVQNEISLDISMQILAVILELNGILFGLSAITAALFLDTLKKRGKKLKRRLFCPQFHLNLLLYQSLSQSQI